MFYAWKDGSFIQQMLIKYLPKARHCVKHLEYRGMKYRQDPCLYGAYSVMGDSHIK